MMTFSILQTKKTLTLMIIRHKIWGDLFLPKKLFKMKLTKEND